MIDPQIPSAPLPFFAALHAWQLPAEGEPRQRISMLGAQIAKGLVESPDFLRLGLMLALERRPVEPRAREMFLSARSQAAVSLTEALTDFTQGLSDAHIHQLVTYAIAGADGLFIAKEVGGDSVDLPALFELHVQALYDSTLRMMAEGQQA